MYWLLSFALYFTMTARIKSTLTEKMATPAPVTPCMAMVGYVQSGAAYHWQGFEDKNLGCATILLGQ